jgi:hypothetical protein
MTINNLFSEVYKMYGAVTRARNCFLYTKKGIRLTDMYQEDGRAILGWAGDSAYTQMKNAMNKGVSGSFITEGQGRVQKAVSKLLKSERKILYFAQKSDALKCGLLFSKDSTAFWKPWNNVQQDVGSIKSVVFVPTFPWTDSLYIVAIEENYYNENIELADFVKNQITVPFPVQAAVTRSVYNLIAALDERKETDWFIYDTILTKYWARKGPYLFSKVPQEKYDSFVMHCLSLGIVINPNFEGTSIVPFGADKGVFTKLKNLPFEF